MKLKNILNENTDRLSSKNKRQVLEAISNFNAFGESIYSKANLKEVVQSISELCENATKLALQEHDDWFDSVTVKRDMKEVAGILKEFVKASTESQSTQQRLESLYEDLGHKLGRYYDINEADNGDMDNDGVDEPDDEEYMDNKDKAIKKAIKNESSTSLKSLLSEHHALGVLPSSKLMKMKWNPLTESEPLEEGASSEEKRIVMMAIKKIAKYRSVPLHHAVSDVMRAAKELEKTIGKK